MRALRSLTLVALFALAGNLSAQQPTTVVKPVEINDVLNNPGIGFMTFQRFNGDALNEGTGWTEGYPIVYQPFHGDLHTKNFPMTSIAYFRVYWRFIEPEKGKFRWDLIDQAISTAHERGQTLMLRIAPYGIDKKEDVPDWYRQEIGEAFPSGLTGGWQATQGKWATAPENPAYVREFGGMIRALGARYDGNPDVELVDLSIVGAWGEGAGTELLTRATLESLLDSYLDTFHKTPLDMQLADKRATEYALARAARSNPPAPPLGWRADCLGDMGFFSPTENLMTDLYPEAIIHLGLADAWKTAPISMEACGVMQSWKNKGEDLKYIIDQSIKWHVSSFNAKSSAVPAGWESEVNEWLNKMGYRFVLRRFTYPSVVDASRKIAFTSWWENKGDAPAYREYRLALRLTRNGKSTIVETNANIKSWMPGDNLYDNAVLIPPAVEDGEYALDLALVDIATNQPKIKLAIAGVEPDGWYPMGKIRVQSHQVESHPVQTQEPVH